MSSVRHWVSGVILVGGGVGVAPQTVAQQQRSTLDSVAAAAKEKVSATASGKDGFSLVSADRRYSLRLRGYLQSDGRFFPRNEAVPNVDNLLIRRARPIIEVTVAGYFELRLMPDFGGPSPSIFDAYWEGKFAPQFTVRAGKFKPPIGLERLQSATDIVFAERGLPTNLVPSRDLGLQLSGDFSEGLLAYQIGVFNGVPDLANGGDDLSDAKDFAGRLLLQPFKRGSLRGLGVGIAGSTGFERGSATAPGLPSYRTPGQQTFFRYNSSSTPPANTVYADGKRTRISPQGYFYTGPLGLLGEYVVSRSAVTRTGVSAELQHTAWQATGSFFLTGEHAGFRSPAPKKPFDLSEGGFGAIELVGRYGQLNLDKAAFPLFATLTASAQRAKAWGVGINWHFTRAVKVTLDYERTTFAGGAPTGDREPENAVITRFQTAF